MAELKALLRAWRKAAKQVAQWPTAHAEAITAHGNCGHHGACEEGGGGLLVVETIESLVAAVAPAKSVSTRASRCSVRVAYGFA